MLPATMAMQMAIVQQNAAMSMIKASADAQKAIVDMLQTVSASSRGNNVNITA